MNKAHKYASGTFRWHNIAVLIMEVLIPVCCLWRLLLFISSRVDNVDCALYVMYVRAELLAQELKELQAELGDCNTVILTVISKIIFGMLITRSIGHWTVFSHCIVYLIYLMQLTYLGKLPKREKSADTRWDTQRHWSCSLATQQSRLELSRLQIWGIMVDRVYKRRVNNVDELKQCLIDVWHGCSRTSLTCLSRSGVNDWKLACIHRDSILNFHYDCLMQT